MKEHILKEYENSKIIYLELEKKAKELIASLIKEKNITIHAIETRVKDKDSLLRKIDRKHNKYSELKEITDILGIRIITYFEDDVDRIAILIKEQFYLDEKNSVDKRVSKNPESFGYSSLHYVVELKEPRVSLPEYHRFNEIKFELQIRSILQHAWAEIEHDIGYKNEIEVPKEIRRNFSRISSLLELADIEFIRMKEEIKIYTEKVKEKIKSQQLDILIDKVSLEEFIISSNIVNDIDDLIIKVSNARKSEEFVGTLDYEIKSLQFLHIATIDQLKTKLKENKEKLVKLAYIWNHDNDRDIELIQGVSILYLPYCIVIESNDENYLLEFSKYINKNNLPNENLINDLKMLFDKL